MTPPRHLAKCLVRCLALLVPALTLALATPFPHPAGADTGAASPSDFADFDERVLFKPSQEPDGGYACYRIPAVVTTNRGTLLAFAEGRKRNCGDATDIDVVVKRSTDGGRTWEPPRVVNTGRGDTHGNPAPVVDRRTGRIVLATTYNKGRADAGNCDVPCNRTPHLQYSDDDGVSWSRPRELTASIRPASWNSWYATGSGHGIQLAHGRHRGRLVIGVNAESHNGTRTSANHAALALSDDGGAHWRLGATDTFRVAADSTYRQKPSELTLAERDDGTVYVNGREQGGTDLGNRDEAVSGNGGAGFTAPFRSLPGLYSPMVQGAVLPLRSGRWLFSAPADPDRRRTMTIRSSYDEGRTWEGAERGRQVTADWSGYSDMTLVGTGTVGLLYEAGKADARQEIRFARFTEEWLGPRRGPDPTTPDRSADGRDAPILGGARQVEGRFGQALAFDGKEAAVRLPYRPSLPLRTRDFTAVLWFRHRAAKGEQPLLWMGGVGGSPQVALYGEPETGRIAGRLTAVAGAGPARTATVRAAGAYDDGQWHQLALRRTGGRLTLAVDGVAVTVADVPGTVSRTSTFGVHLGQKPDGRAYLTGDLDEVRVYGRGLTDAELARLRETNAAPERRDAVLWLPLDRTG
ncbi:sialidase-1 [Streptomyces olivoverticillatus]|uniref:exo-alpha-sialidase n=1 Tax=Streptomyces olivoverticillatus TaxID=66427 RepID=A0A7W7PP17_9ACTN|nr:sialidase-1 [Streptomyces olivoverticillatus]